MKTVIVGGVAGGASAAARLRRLDESAEIIILERGGYVSFANCALPFYIGDVIVDKAELTLQTPQSFKNRFNVTVEINSDVIKVNPSNKTVTVKDSLSGDTREVSYDNLILSPGAKPILPPIPGIELEQVFTIRNIPDTYKLKTYMQEKKPTSAVVVGGGYIGMEMAENLHKAGLQVTIVELGDHLIGPIDWDMSRILLQHVKAKGLKVILKDGVKTLEQDGSQIKVHLSEESFNTDIVIMSVGVLPDTKFLENSGIELGQRGAILTDKYMKTNIADIYAVGDAVQVTDFVTEQAAFIPLAGPANKQGRIVADNIAGIKSTYNGTQGSAILGCFGLTVASTGISEATATRLSIPFEKSYSFPKSHASYYPQSTQLFMKLLYNTQNGKILGAQIIGEKGADKRCDVIAVAIRGGLTVDDLVDLELCYAPQFNSAKDPVNLAGMITQNIYHNRVKSFHWNQIPAGNDVILLDVRTKKEFEGGTIQGFINIPLDELRQRINELDPNKKIYITCQVGLRGYVAAQILSQKNFDCWNLSGGYTIYTLLTKDV